jgi:4-hydroxybenzoate polyprenyl transferase
MTATKWTDPRVTPDRPPTLAERLRRYALLTRMHRPIGTLLLLWPCLWALWIAADGVPDPLVLAVFVAGTFLMRSAGCAINDYADRAIDGHVARTRDRPVAAGLVSPNEALAVAAVFSLVAFALVLLMNTLTIALAVIGLLLAATYPYAKRVTYLPQVHLGAAFGWAVPMAFAAQAGALPPLAWLLYLGAILWATIYDTMYAMADRPEDLKIGVKSTAILFGRPRLALRRRPGRRGRLHDPPPADDRRARAHGLLPRLPRQQLARRRHYRRRHRRLRPARLTRPVVSLGRRAPGTRPRPARRRQRRPRAPAR